MSALVHPFAIRNKCPAAGVTCSGDTSWDLAMSTMAGWHSHRVLGKKTTEEVLSRAVPGLPHHDQSWAE